MIQAFAPMSCSTMPRAPRAFVQSTPVAHPCSAAGDRDDVAARRDPVARGRHVDAFEIQQRAFGGRSAAVAAHRAVGADDPMARHYDRDGVGRAGCPDGANGLGRTRKSGQRAVAGGGAVADVGRQVLEHHAAKSLGELPIQRHVEVVPASGEILVELPRDGVEAGRGVQHAGADPVGQVLQDGVVALAAERHSHQPDRLSRRSAASRRASRPSGRRRRAGRRVRRPPPAGPAGG